MSANINNRQNIKKKKNIFKLILYHFTILLSKFKQINETKLMEYYPSPKPLKSIIYDMVNGLIKIYE